MSFSPSKKRTPKLPENFQEVLATHEMNLNEGITVDLIRNLIYIYTIGMEYYDYVHKDKLQMFYSNKISELLSRKDIIDFLDKNPVDFNTRENINLFPDYKRETIIKNNNNEIINLNTLNNKKLKKNKTFKIMNEKLDQNEMKNEIKTKILFLDKKFQKIDEAISQRIIDQMSKYEEKKREMITKNKVKRIEKKIENKKRKNTEEEEMLILEEIENYKKQNNNEEENKEEKNIEIKKRKNSIKQNQMLKEIEEYVQKNMDEMYKSLEEIKASFEDEIKEAEENGYPDIAQGLKEDLEAELENMKDQYEEQRRVETDKIREKYKKNRVF